MGHETTSLALMDLPGTHRQDFGASAADDHDHGHEHEDEHEAEAEAAQDHDHSGLDPRAWLDPGNGQLWLGAIADALSTRDPETPKPMQPMPPERATIWPRWTPS